MDAAIETAEDGDTIELLKDVESAGQITLPEGVTLDGNGKSISLTDKIEQGAFIETSSANVTIKDVIINTNGNAKHGVQFYCANDGKLENVTVNGGFYTSVIVNGATVAIETVSYTHLKRSHRLAC